MQTSLCVRLPLSVQMTEEESVRILDADVSAASPQSVGKRQAVLLRLVTLVT